MFKIKKEKHKKRRRGKNMEKVKTQGRNSGIELLRIVCLILIFWMHASGSYTDNTVSAWLSIAASVIGNIGVSCFILISGYYGIRLNIKKMMHLDLMLIFYSWIALILQFVWGNSPGGEEILSHIFPVIGKQSWYFTCYFALAFLSPFLNEMIEKMEEKRLKSLIITMLVIFSGITTVFFFDINGDGGKGIVHMVMLYLIGRYIGIYWRDREYKTGKLAGAFVAVAAVNFCLNGALFAVTGTVQNRYARDNTLFTIAEAILLFLIFRNIYFENKMVNRLAGHVPAVFIFEWTLRSIITLYIVDYLQFSGSDFYELILIAVACLIVVLGIVIDFLRVTLLSIPETWLVNQIYAAGEQISKKVHRKL